MRPDAGHAGGGQRLGLAMLLVEVAPFGYGEPGPGSGQDLLAGGVAGGRDHEVGRGDVRHGILHPAAMLNVGGLGRVPVPLDRSDGDPARAWTGAGADAECCLAEAAPAAAGHHQDHLLVGRNADPTARCVPLDQPGVSPQTSFQTSSQTAREAGARAHRRIPFRLCQGRMERGQQSHRAVIGGLVAGIAAIAVLEHRHLRHAADPGELRDLGRHVADHQRRVRPVEPFHDRRHRPSDRRPSQRRAMQRSRGGQVIHARRLVAARLEQGRDHDDLRPGRKRREDVVAGAEHHQRARGRQRVRDRGAAFGVTAALVVDEVAERLRHAAVRWPGGASAGSDGRRVPPRSAA